MKANLWHRLRHRFFQREKKEIVEYEVVLKPYYFTSDARQYQDEIAELRRQLANARDAQKQAEKFALESWNRCASSGASVRAMLYTREELRNLLAQLEQIND